ncbi:transcriptional regulator SlyA [Aeromonas jandaei]|uniref:transcriptional regulator SlyA n=1 Tax=Aeromonas lacus TaxID=558884 RepID=UPI00051BFA4D|nr:transcriptional regulator SlyA [Aeromonas lacus]
MKDLERLRELSLAEQIARMHRLWRTAADLELAPLGLTHPRWTALWKLSRMGNHVSQKTLADALEIELPSLMRTLGQLEEQGLIERHCCSQDKRARIVSVTPTGQTLLDQIANRIMNIRRELLAGIDEETLSLFEATVQRISANALSKIETHHDNESGGQSTPPDAQPAEE